jgi:hypothetical protein
MERVDRRGQRIRLVGVSVSGLRKGESPRQVGLFEAGPEEGGAPDGSARSERLKRAIDEIRSKFGPDALRHGISLARESHEPRERKGP